MVRPCFLVIDREFPGSISTRKLVIETAKFNVITAYSAQEAVDTLKMFGALHGVVMDTDVTGMHCEALVQALKLAKSPGVANFSSAAKAEGADFKKVIDRHLA